MEKKKKNKQTKKQKTTHQKQKQKKPTLNSFYPLEYICQVEIGPGIMNVKSLHATKTMTDNRKKIIMMHKCSLEP